MKDVNLLINNGVNIKKSMELFGDMATYDDTLQDFLNDVENKLSDIKKYKEISDMSNYAILVHSLKSDSKYFGFDKLAELSYQHEMESKKNNVYYVVEHYEELITEANRIIALVKKYLNQESENETISNTKVVEKNQTILVVDDSVVVVNFIKKIFHDTYHVVVASDGKEAIDFINKDVEHNIVAMLLDLNMPNVDGFEVLEYFNQNNLFSRIPVSIITGSDEKNIIDRAFSYPIVDMLTKPFNELNVKQIVEKTIQ